MRNVLAVVPKGSQEMVATIIGTIFAGPDTEHIQKQFREVTTMLELATMNNPVTVIDQAVILPELAAA